jgi:hypothetical protein
MSKENALSASSPVAPDRRNCDSMGNFKNMATASRRVAASRRNCASIGKLKNTATASRRFAPYRRNCASMSVVIDKRSIRVCRNIFMNCS